MTDALGACPDAPACIIYHGPSLTPDLCGMTPPHACEIQPQSDHAAEKHRDRKRHRHRPHTCWHLAEQLFEKRGECHGPAVLVVDESMLDRIADLTRLPRHVIIVAADERAEAALARRAHVSLVGLADPEARHRMLRAACQFSAVRRRSARQQRLIAQGRHEIHELKRIGMALMNEHDRSGLLHLIVDQGKRLTQSDSGGLFLIETGPDGDQLRLALYESDSLPEAPVFLANKAIPLDNTSIIGHAAAVRKPISIADAHALPPDAGFERDPSLDRQTAYHIRSMLIVPMVDHRDRVVGVLVFVNRKTDRGAKLQDLDDVNRYVLQYTGRQMRFARALAGQAAVSLETARLYAQIENIFESFVKAAVTAIDRRDPTTAGHSVRVATLTTDLAGAVERNDRGRFADVHFTRDQMRELHYASLLHDFGKIAVHEDVLVKAKKLPPILYERVGARFDLIRRTIELEHCRKRPRKLRSPKAEEAAQRVAMREAEQLAQLDQLEEAVRAVNEPDVESARDSAELREGAAQTFPGPDLRSTPYLTEDELHYLQLPHGTLDDRERAEIESHVEHTYRFLSSIPWTDDLKNLPAYAYGHHEKLDGSGYPRHIRGDQIPIQTRMMTIADIFDALTASDRPYRRAVPPDKALDILRAEAGAGRLDSDLVDLLIESQVYRRLLEVDWRLL